MIAFHTSRRFALAGLLVLSAVAGAHAQRGGGPGGPGGGGGQGGPPGGGPGGPGMMGGAPRGGDMGNNRGPNTRGGAGMPARNGPPLGLPGRWWDDKHTAKDLALRADQQRRMDEIFDTNKNNLLSLYANMKQAEEKLGSMSRQDLQDESKVFAAIDRVAQARAEVQKANAHILLMVRKELDAQQLSTLDKQLSAAR